MAGGFVIGSAIVILWAWIVSHLLPDPVADVAAWVCVLLSIVIAMYAISTTAQQMMEFGYISGFMLIAAGVLKRSNPRR